MQVKFSNAKTYWLADRWNKTKINHETRDGLAQSQISE